MAVTVLGAMGCSSCRKQQRHDFDSSAPMASFEVAPGRLFSPWFWEPTDARDVALPAGCEFVGPPLRHRRSTTNLFFFASPGELHTLAMAQGDPNPDSVTESRGLVTLSDKGAGAVRDVPWLHLTDPPLMTSSSQGWLALLVESDGLGLATRLWLWREAGAMELVAEGDRLQPIDAQCNQNGCALLTTRVGQVATRGATAWLGQPMAPMATWLRLEIPPDAVADASVPLGLVSWDASSHSALIAFEDSDRISFLRVTDTKVERQGSIERDYGIVDYLPMRDGPMVVTTWGEPDDIGCVPGGAFVQFTTLGKQAHRLRVAMLPSSGYARALEHGALITWSAPMQCNLPNRKVVYAVLLHADGAPASSIMAVGN
ncbi:MAG TPA: hypothetical protein PKW66_28615, partial [Polyangiaceae bacterium]|nr:hypothetical protein [Polyangiaceae bacterium]